MCLTTEQREALTDAVIEGWRDRFLPNIDQIIDDILFHGRVGFSDYSDVELVDLAEEGGLHDRLVELGITRE